MKRLVLIISLILLLALSACDTMGPTQQEVLPTDAAAPLETTQPAPDSTAATTGEEAEGTTDEAGADLHGVVWEWVSLLDPMGQTTATDPARYTITFNAGGTANVRADCNNVVANYITDGVNLMVEPGVTTLAACPEDTQDQLFLNSLASAESYVVQDNELFITMSGASGTVIFRAATGETSGEPPAGGMAGLTDITWEWVSTTTAVEEIAATDPTRYTIFFSPDGTAGITADCNVGNAEYVAGEDGSMTITLGVSTLAFCENSQDTVFRSGLEAATGFRSEGNDLLIELSGGESTMRFRNGGALESAGGDTELTGIIWQWVSTASPTEEIVAADPTRYTIFFSPDGTAGLNADCNVGNAEYTTTEDGSITITLGVSTLAFCENSQDTVFRGGLEAAAMYRIEDGALLLDLADGAGTMRFQNGGALTTDVTPPSGETLTGVTWEWVKTVTPVEEIVAADQTRYNIVFNEDGTANIKADCNTGLAVYTQGDDGTLTITPGAMTLALCPEDSQVTQFMSGLSAAATYFFMDGNLHIDQFASAGTMQFAPAGMAGGETGVPDKGDGVGSPAGFVGTVWQLNTIAKRDGNVTINDPSRYTVAFNADGTLNLQADCNVGGAAYTTGDGNVLTITPGPMTMAFCGPGSLDQIFIGGLTNAQGYRLEDGNLIIDMLYESGSMVFSPTS
ncbi:MAG: META domain-containing protein [Candidatus Promineofilum sp.]|nr:META domain-containing protein [Promineifilum sp.]